MKIPEYVKQAVKTKSVFTYETFYPSMMNAVKRYCKANGYRLEGKTAMTMCGTGYIRCQEFVEIF